ncbi:nucleoside hydrolase [Tundrisphaera sp. TA3]|uniref:nucleoside hydrolase n=1 Tax=Tundrisphaera sp. TA3 TaxID=3435775 RepID=UPI003EB8D270
MNMPIAIALIAGVVGQGPPARRPVVLTTDIGAEVDDQWALVHLALLPGIDLKGIVTTHSPSLPAPAAEGAARIAREWLARLPEGRRPPVLAGSNRPLFSKEATASNPGVDFLLEQARGRTPADRLTVIVLGAATDVASALRIDPAWADRVTIVAMGFNEWDIGGDVWNVKNDPDAWRTLLESSIPIVVGDSALTRKALAMTPDRARRLLADGPEPGPALVRELEAWLARSGKLAESETGSATTWPIWDEVTTAILLGLATAETRPRPRLNADLSFDHSRPAGEIRWVTAIDADALWADLAARIRAGRRED